jgi:rare lipoprotein A (peptidoglycan hydrolase)
MPAPVAPAVHRLPGAGQSHGSGELRSRHELTAAHRTRPLGTIVRVQPLG